MLRHSWVLTAFVLLVGCESGDERNLSGSPGNATDTGPSPASTDTQSDTLDGTGSDSQNDPTGSNPDSDSEVCEEQPFAIERDAGRLMILQDLSFSMILDKRWEQGRSALQSLLGNDQFAAIEFGFDFFPTSASNGCGINASVPLDCAPGQAASMATSLNDIEVSDGATPLYCAMKNYLNESYAPAFHGLDKPHFLLLVSDGQPTCPKECNKSSGTPVDPQNMGALTAQLLAMGITTIPIGFKYSDQDDPEYLTQIAQNGGSGYADYIPANDQAQLEAALHEVAGAVVSCVFEIKATNASADPSKVNFYFTRDGKEGVVGYDEGCSKGLGWTWTDDSHTYIEFCTQSCEELKDGLVEQVTAKFGCSSVVV